MILIGVQFEVSSSFNFILHNALLVTKADGIIVLDFPIALASVDFQSSDVLRTCGAGQR
jgi:hypothetical protein